MVKAREKMTVKNEYCIVCLSKGGALWLFLVVFWLPLQGYCALREGALISCALREGWFFV